MKNTTFTEQDYELMGRATFRSVVNSLQYQLPELRQKMNRRIQATQPGIAKKAKTAVKPAAAKTTATKQPAAKPAPQNTAVNWNLINNLPHNRDADNATYSEKNGFTSAELELTKNL